jgi:sortase A
MTTMNKLKILILIICFSFLGAWYAIESLDVQKQEQKIAFAEKQRDDVLKRLQEEAARKPGIPTHVSIPKIGIESFVEQVGLDEAGKMDVPKKDEDVGWFSLGYKPGDNGSAVLAGHLDTVKGTPAVFWDLAKLNLGDEIIVTDDKNHTFYYVVTNKTTYVYDQVPLDKIFAQTGEPILNLITCGGSFNRAARNYTHRTIIESKMVQRT